MPTIEDTDPCRICGARQHRTGPVVTCAEGHQAVVHTRRKRGRARSRMGEQAYAVRRLDEGSR